MKTFETELAELINKYSKDIESNTPDFILSLFVSNCLNAFSQAVQSKENWYGKHISDLPLPKEK